MLQGDKGISGGFGVAHHGNGNRPALADVPPLRSILSDVKEHIGELTINLDGIKKQIDFYRNSLHKSPCHLGFAST